MNIVKTHCARTAAAVPSRVYGLNPVSHGRTLAATGEAAIAIGGARRHFRYTLRTHDEATGAKKCTPSQLRKLYALSSDPPRRQLFEYSQVRCGARWGSPVLVIAAATTNYLPQQEHVGRRYLYLVTACQQP